MDENVNVKTSVSTKVPLNSKPKKEKEKLSADLKILILDVVLNGLFLNFAFFVLIDKAFTFYSFIGYGLAWYYLREEVPRIINKILLVNRWRNTR